MTTNSATFTMAELLQDSTPVVLPLVVILVVLIFSRRVLIESLTGRTVKFNLSLLVIIQLSGAIFIGAISEFYMAKIGSEIVEISEVDIPLTNKISEIEMAQLHQLVWFERAVLFSIENEEEKLANAKKNIDKYNDKIVESITASQAIFKNSSSLAHSEESKLKLNSLHTRLNSFQNHYESFSVSLERAVSNLKLGTSPSYDEVHKIENEEDELSNEIESILLDIEEFTLKSALRAERDEKMAEVKVLLIIVLTFLCSLVFVTVVVKVLNGSLSVASESLVDTTSKISEVSEGLSARSIELQSVSKDSLKSLHETSGSMVEISSINENNFDRIRRMQKSRETVEHSVQQAQDHVHQLAVSIEQIESANKELSKIQDIIRKIDNETDVINSIVFKTQLLSVNASIEAASAGEFGKGFSVVADEVSKLANMSGDSAQAIDDLLDQSGNQVKYLLENINNRVQSGVDAAKSVKEVIKVISHELEEMTEQNKDVYNSAREQNIGIKRIEDALKVLRNIAEKENEVSQIVNGYTQKLMENQENLQAVSGDVVKLVESS